MSKNEKNPFEYLGIPFAFATFRGFNHDSGRLSVYFSFEYQVRF